MGNGAYIQKYQFKKGSVPNPTGRPKLPEHLRHIRQFTADEIARIISKFGRADIDEINAVLEDTEAAMIDRIIAKLYAQALKKGDYTALNFLMDRAIGKAQAIPDILDENDLSKLSIHELLQIVKNVIPGLKIPEKTDSQIIIEAMKDEQGASEARNPD